MRRLIVTRGLETALKAEGFDLPKECAEVRLILGPNGPFVIEYRVFLTAEDVARLGRALIRHSEINT